MPIDSGNLALKGLDDLFSTEENRQEEQREQVQQIPIDALHRPGHGFIVQHFERVVGEGVQCINGNLLYLLPLFLLSVFFGGKQVI